MIIVTPNNVKLKILKKEELNNTLNNVTFYSLEELTKRLTFSYSKKAIYYLMKKYGFKYEVAIVYLDNIKYLETNNYQELEFLYKIKKELDDEKLLEYDPYFHKYLDSQEVLFLGYSYIPKFLLKKINNYRFYKQETKNKKYQVHEFITMEEEVSFVAYEIVKLLNSGVDINKIKLIADSEYYFVLENIFNFYHIPLNISSKTPLYQTFIGKTFLNNLSFDGLNQDSDIYNKIITIINEYSWCDNLSDIKDLLEYELKNTYKEEDKYLDAVTIESITNNIFDNDEYVFLMGFNEGKYPLIHYDEDYISDNIKAKIGLEISDAINAIYKDSLIKTLSNINHLFISYKLQSPFSKYYPSILIQELNMEVMSHHEQNYSSSNLYNQIRLGKYLDNFTKYHEFHPDINKLYSTYPLINYQGYDNKFTEINIDNLHKYLHNHLTLSYTAIDKFYKCGFMFYLNNILKLDIKEDTFALFIGSLFHYVLSKAFLDHFDFEKSVNDFKNERVLTAKEEFLLSKLKEELKFIINTIQEQQKHLAYIDALYEEKVIINREGNIKITFIGVIDKILYKECHDSTYLVLIDYKTGAIDLNLNDIVYGFNLQLPIYLYLAKQLKKFKNPKIYGFYLQPILFNETSSDNKKSYEQQKQEAMRLHGYSIDKCEAEFVLLNDKSKIIRGLRQKQDGTYYKGAKVLNEKDMDLIYEITEAKINEAINDITNGKFHINPKVLDHENVSCKYCQYFDICYKTIDDEIRLNKVNKIGGEGDAMDN